MDCANKRRTTAFTRRFNINPTAIERRAHGTDTKRKRMHDDKNRCVSANDVMAWLPLSSLSVAKRASTEVK